MAKILTFRNKDKGTAPQDFLTDDAEKLSFRTAEDGAVSLGDMPRAAMPDLLPDPKKDWTNQELADLFRVRQLLSGANVVVDTTRGVTDEGDPWFIFCHHNGDVFIHMARIDGLYVLDSPNVRRPLRGRDFNALIADYTNHALPAATHGDAEAAHRVIRLERGGTVRLHPSAMLAALIWTLFLAAEDIVLLAPEEQTADSDDLLDFSDVISADFDFDGIEMETADTASLGVPEAMKSIDTDVLHGTPEAQVQMREAMGQQGLAMHQNAFAMGLSTIAIAMGFMSEAVLLDNQRKVLEGLNKIGFTQYAANVAGPEIDQVAAQDGDTLIDVLAEFLGLDLSRDTHVAEAPVTNGDASLLQQQILHATEATDTSEIPVAVAKTVQTVLREDNDIELSETAHVETTSSQEAEIVVAINAEQDEALDESNIAIFESFYDQLHMEEFQLGETTVQASFDLTTEDFNLVEQFVLVEPTVVATATTTEPENLRTTAHREFDDRAQSFIDYIQSKDTEVGVITIGNELIMIDRAALLESGANTYSFSWETNEGQVISLIGLRAEFQEFDLIA